MEITDQSVKKQKANGELDVISIKCDFSVNLLNN